MTSTEQGASCTTRRLTLPNACRPLSRRLPITTKAIAESLYEEFEEPLYSPPPMLARMVEARLLGRKTGRGFHTYRENR